MGDPRSRRTDRSNAHVQTLRRHPGGDLLAGAGVEQGFVLPSGRHVTSTFLDQRPRRRELVPLPPQMRPLRSVPDSDRSREHTGKLGPQGSR